MRELESCIIEMNEVAALLRMIDDTFVCGRVGMTENKDGVHLELAMNLLREEFEMKYEKLRTVFYGGACHE